MKLWWGTFWIDHYAAYANSAEEALNYVVAYLEKKSPKLLEGTDLGAEELINDLIEDGTAKTRDEAYDTPEFQESYTYVDATMEGADEPHYVHSENLAVEEYPEEFEHPAEPGVQRRKPVMENKRCGIHESNNTTVNKSQSSIHDTLAKSNMDDITRMNNEVNKAIEMLDRVNFPDDVRDKVTDVRSVLLNALPSTVTSKRLTGSAKVPA